MGRQELVLALKQKGETETRKIWQQARGEAEQYREQRREESARLGKMSDRKAEQDSESVCRQVDWQVAKKVRTLRLRTLEKLDRRLRTIAGRELDLLAADKRRSCFDKLADELPVFEWETVTVHPDNAEDAARRFAASTCRHDPGLFGGLVVEKDDGTVRVDNSLRQRLWNAWPELVGRTIVDLEKGEQE